MADGLPAPPLLTLLGHVVVACTIEFDDAFEARMPHRTSESPGAGVSRSGPWLTSRVMGVNTTLHIGDDEAVTVAELHHRARTSRDSLAGLRRWGYVRTTGPEGNPGPAETAGGRRHGGRRGITLSSEVTLTGWGRRANRVWRELPGELEPRWRTRWGAAAFDQLGRALDAVLGRSTPPAGGLPRSLPVIAPATGGHTERPSDPEGPEDPETPLADLLTRLSRVTQTLVLDAERDLPIGHAVAATTMAALHGGPQRSRDLPGLAGIGKEASTAHLGLLVRRGWAVERSAPPGTDRTIDLTERGRTVEREHRDAVAGVHQPSEASKGATLDALYSALVAVDASPDGRRLLTDLVHPPGTWRAGRRRPSRLPDAAVILHRGGYPDGS